MPGKMGVCISVVREQMSARVDFTDQIRTSPREFAYDEKRDLRLMAIEQIQQLRRDRGVRTIIESKCEPARRTACR